ncbi:MAG TPA: YhjD/YihY/BrkB family envelope integrity protein, partial [Acidobacteriaceae bacterium]|nr:YhjD/YihY/BrkB family envelope integrity protein [Acidobacteriaceae bacterium]
MRRARKPSKGRIVRLLRLGRPAVEHLKLFRATIYAALEHDSLTVAQATAYSAMVALFPALIVSAAIVALLPDTLPFRFQMAMFFDRILPSNVSPLLESYFEATHKSPQTSRALIGSIVVSITGAASVMATLMEGFRRAHNLPLEAAAFWRRRMRALAAHIGSSESGTSASALVVFGHIMTQWMANHF